MKIPTDNAFKINRLVGSFFPFSVKVAQKEEVTCFFICAQRVIDLCDLIQKYAKSHLVLFGIGQTSVFDKKTGQLIPLEELAEAAHIQFSAVDSETIVLPKEKLLPLLMTFDHYEFTLFDIDRDWEESQVIKQVLDYREYDWQSQNAFLNRIPASTLFLTSHDDCYLNVESYNPMIAQDIFIRTLQTYAGTIFERNQCGDFLEISDFPKDMLDLFWKDDFGLTILKQNTEMIDTLLKIGLSLKPFSFKDSMDYPSELWLVYDTLNQSWHGVS
jgi:hypothetical protein